MSEPNSFHGESHKMHDSEPSGPKTTEQLAADGYEPFELPGGKKIMDVVWVDTAGQGMQGEIDQESDVAKAKRALLEMHKDGYETIVSVEGVDMRKKKDV